MSIETKKDKKNKEGISRRIDTIFDNFRDELESTMKWPLSYDLGFPIFFDEKESRKALCDLIDKDDRYEGDNWKCPVLIRRISISRQLKIALK